MLWRDRTSKSHRLIGLCPNPRFSALGFSGKSDFQLSVISIWLARFSAEQWLIIRGNLVSDLLLDTDCRGCVQFQATALFSFERRWCSIQNGRGVQRHRHIQKGRFRAKCVQASATVYSVMETAKANGLNPEKYISHLLTVLPERFAHDPKAQINDLLPWSDGLHDLCHA